MRIVCLTHTPAPYGANLSMLGWLRELHARGHQFLIIGPRGPIEEQCAALGIAFHAFQPSWWAAEPDSMRRLAVFRSLFAARFAHRELAARITAFHPDLLYSNSGVMPLGWLLSKRLRIPHAWHLREFMDLHFGYTAALGWPLTRRVIRRADATISVSRALQNHLIPNPRPRNIVIYEGIASREQLQARARAGENFPTITKSAPFCFVLVGMLQSGKGQHLAIRALAALHARGHKARLKLVGGGPTQPLRDLAASHGIAGSVEFTGHLADPAPAVLASHAALMFSRAEAFGRTTVEAMSLARPVIGLRTGATPELITDGKTGLLCDNGHESVASAMTQFVTSPDFAAALGRHAARAAQRYSNETYADDMEKFFQQFQPATA